MKCDNSELEPNKDNATSTLDFAVPYMRVEKVLFGFCIQTPTM